jgi:hypothetical protein
MSLFRNIDKRGLWMSSLPYRQPDRDATPGRKVQVSAMPESTVGQGCDPWPTARPTACFYQEVSPMMDFTGAPHVGTRPHTPERVAPLTNFGFTPQAGTTESHLDRHTVLAAHLADPAGAVLTALNAWFDATRDPDDVHAVALIQGVDLHLGGSSAEGITARQAAILANLLRLDTQLRTAQHRIPSAPSGIGAQR